MKKFKILLTALLSVSFVACSQPKQPAPPPAESAPTFKPPTPEEMQKAFEKMSTTTAEHETLKQVVGTWNTKTSWWMDPSGQPEVTKGSSVQKTILGGKFIQQDFKGHSMGKPFSGIGYMGFDTVTSKYTSSWIDSMSTGTSNGTGNYDQHTKTWTFNNEMSCPIMNGPVKFSSKLKIINKNQMVYEMYAPGFEKNLKT
jgi:Protein of unknown function (DUF1579)